MKPTESPPPPRPSQAAQGKPSFLKGFLLITLVLLVLAVVALIVLNLGSGDGSAEFNYGGFNG
jgi:hypothetical protein